MTTLQFNAIFRFAKEARVYLETVSGALSRFTNIDTVYLINHDCFDKSVTEMRDDGRGLKDSHELQFRLAAVDLSSMPEAVVRRIAPLHRGAPNIKRLLFDGELENEKFSDLATIRTGLWTDSRRRTHSAVVGLLQCEPSAWLDYFPGVSAVSFNDWPAFCNSSRLCGAKSRESLKVMSIDRMFFSEGMIMEASNSGLSRAMARDLIFMELIHFRQLETLLLVFMGREDAEFFGLPDALELLPNLETLAIDFEDFQSDNTALLHSVFRDPSLPVEGRCKLRIYFANAFDRGDNSMEAMRMLIAGDSLPEWEVTEAPDGVKGTVVLPGPGDIWLDSCWLATFHPST